MPDAGGGRADPFAPLTSEQLQVSDGHELYVESVGRKGGIPAVYLHGGPGSGCQPDHRRLFDPERFHAVLFDQRGCGRSRPKGSREMNALPHLVADMEWLRIKFGLERWMLVGGSWGATLALAYAQAHPDRVSGIVLRATFLGTYEEIEAGFCDVLPRFYPGLYQDFLSLLPEAERSRPLDAYWRRILDPDAAVHAPAARAWHDTERMLSEHTRSNRAAPCPRRPSWKHITSSTTVSCGRTSFSKMPADCPAFPASSCRAATTCSARPRPRRRSPRAGRMLRSASWKAPAIRCTIPASGTP
jgi:proline iminopeptidase